MVRYLPKDSLMVTISLKGNNCIKMPFFVAIKVFVTKPEVTLRI